MMRYWRWMALILIVACVSVTGAQSTPATASALDREFMGMVIRDPDYEFNTNPQFPNQANKTFLDTMGANLERLGVRWVRFEFRVQLPLDASNAQIDAEISKYDYFIQEVAPRHNLKVLALLGFGLVPSNPRDLNCTSSSCILSGSRFGGGVNQAMDAWLNRSLRIADRYRSGIAAYEILNEQNRLPQFEGSGAAGDAIQPNILARMIAKFHRFCRNLEPTNENHGCSADTQIVLGGLHPAGTNNSWTDQGYLAAVYNTDTTFSTFLSSYKRPAVDAIAYHPYPEEITIRPNNVLVDHGLSRMRSTMAAVGSPCTPFWITEIGYNVGFDPDGPKNPTPQQTEAGQATFMRDVYTTMAARVLPDSSCGGKKEIANVFWFKYEDFPPAEDIKNSKGNVVTPAQRWGVVRIPFDANGNYAIDGVPSTIRSSFRTYMELSGTISQLSHSVLLPFVRQ